MWSKEAAWLLPERMADLVLTPGPLFYVRMTEPRGSARHAAGPDAIIAKPYGQGASKAGHPDLGATHNRMLLR